MYEEIEETSSSLPPLQQSSPAATASEETAATTVPSHESLTLTKIHDMIVKYGKINKDLQRDIYKAVQTERVYFHNTMNTFDRVQWKLNDLNINTGKLIHDYEDLYNDVKSIVKITNITQILMYILISYCLIDVLIKGIVSIMFVRFNVKKDRYI